MEAQKFSIKKRAKSVGFAVNGLHQFFSTQHNAILHAVATILVITLAVIIQLPLSKCLFIVMAIGLVWMAELFNTAIEQLCDMVCPQQHPTIKFIKDVAAAAVLVAALTALTIACIIFIPALL